MWGVDSTPHDLILPCLMGAVFFCIFLIGVRNLLRRNPVTDWAITTGVIRQSHVTGRKQQNPLVRYEYEYSGRRYESDRITYVERTYSSHRSALAEARKYPYGAKVTVYVNPADPGESVLDPDPQRGEALITLFGGIAALLILAVIVIKN